MSYVRRDGVALYYETHGAGPAILLTHGFAATAQMWTPQIKMLEADFTVIAWDLRGHGRSDSPTEPAAYTEAETVADMTAVLDANGVARAVIAGHSLGGYMSLAFHASHADRVSGLVLSGTGPGYRRSDAREAWNAKVNQLAEEIDRGGLLPAGLTSAEMDLGEHASVRGLVNAARGMLTQRDSRIIESLGTVTVPTLIAVGSRDGDYLNGTEYLESSIPAAERIIFEGAGHTPSLELPDEFNAELERFLTSKLIVSARDPRPV